MFSWAPLLSLNSGWVPLRCALDHSPSTAPLHMPHNGEHKQNLSPSSPAQCGLVMGSAPEKYKTKEQFSIVWKSNL